MQNIDLQNYGLGMERGSLLVSPHNPRWLDAYTLVESALKAIVADPAVSFHHIGSTAIPGIKAKPILDILGTTPSIEAFDQYKPALEKAGLTWKGEFGIPGRRYSVLYDRAQKVGYVHLHIFQEKNFEVKRHLLFAKYLQQRPELAKKYEELKENLIYKRKLPRAQYSQQKTTFIESVLKLARAEGF